MIGCLLTQILNRCGAALTVPLQGDLADGQLSPGESFVVELLVGLQSFSPFTFLVDVLGVEVAP